MKFSSNRYPYLTVKIGSAREQIMQTGAIRVLERAKNIRFEKGWYETEDIKIIELLLHHPSYNVDFFGPFSKADIMSGEYEKTLKDHINIKNVDSTRPNVQRIGEEAASKIVQTIVKNEALGANQVKETTKVSVAEIQKKDSERIKGEADKSV